MSEEIKGLVDPEYWQTCVEKNDDPYGGACVKVARNVMKHLDDFEGDFNIGYNPDMTTAHGIICKCDDQGGLTGFMANQVSKMIVCCYKDGWKFWLSFHISQYDVDNEERLQEFVDKLVRADLGIKREDVEQYMNAMVQRFKEERDKDNWQGETEG